MLKESEPRPETPLPVPEQLIEIVDESGAPINPHTSVYYLQKKYAPHSLLLYYRLNISSHSAQS